MNSQQSGLQTYAAAHAASALWAAHFRGVVQAVHHDQVPPSVDVTLLRYNTLFTSVPVATSPFTSALPQVGDTVSVYFAEGIRDNVWVAQDLPRSDNAQPLPSPAAYRFLHPSGVMLQVDDDGNVLALYPSGATVALGGASDVEVSAATFHVSGAAATGTATFTGTAGASVPEGLPMTGGGYLWYTTASGVIGADGTLALGFRCATGGTKPNGSGPTALAFPLTGVTGVSGTASGGAAATSIALDAAAITLADGTAGVARVGDSITVTVGGTPYSGTITSGSSIVKCG